MALRESEIVRYSRQILLREIGGHGQERLLATTVELGSGGAALSTAAAYLAASGVRVIGGPRWRAASEAGFLVERDDEIPPASADGGRAGLWVAETPAGVPDAPCARVLLGSTGAEARIVFGSPTTRVALLQRVAPVAAVPVGDAELVGALAGLVVQRLILGLGDGAGCLRIDPSGAVELLPLEER